MTLAVACLVGSACATAAIVTCKGLSPGLGAVYRPAEEIGPYCALPPGVPFTCHRTPVSEEPVMVASNCSVPPLESVALVGEIETETGGGGMWDVPLLGVPVVLL